jgi:N-acetylmuramoyl-L-alanine amidase
MLRLRLLDVAHQPLANTPCELHMEGSIHSLTTDGDGLIEEAVTATAESATLVFRDPLLAFDVGVPIKIGHLDPVSEPSGQKARLHNLGYNPGPLTEDDADRFATAVQEFQCDQGLKVTGVADAATQDRLTEVHGC